MDAGSSVDYKRIIKFKLILPSDHKLLSIIYETSYMYVYQGVEMYKGKRILPILPQLIIVQNDSFYILII